MLLQLALDFVEIDRAIKIAEETKKYVDWLEAGTPLIKSEGMDAIRELKRRFPNKKIVADMKIVDTGALEVEMAAKAGADIITIMASADNSTIREAVEAGRRYGAKIMVDILNVDRKRAKEMEEMGVDYICVHVGIDQQMRGESLIGSLSELKGVGLPLCVAGGITKDDIGILKRAGADVIIVGKAIINSENAERAAKLIKEAMEVGRERMGKVESVKEKIVRIFKLVSTPNISDALQRKGEMTGLYAITPGVKLVGQAFTIRAYPGDWAKPVEGIDIAKEGDVIVIDAGGGKRAVWGELATWSCVQKGILGVVIDGGIRDVDEIRKLKFPAFAKHISPTAGEPKGLGEINIEILCGGVSVKPGDWVIGDDNGIVVVPYKMGLEIANRALDICEKENRIRKEIKEKSSLGKVLKLKKWEKEGIG